MGAVKRPLPLFVVVVTLLGVPVGLIMAHQVLAALAWVLGVEFGKALRRG